MKTIFVFDDSRITDPDFPVLALSEDGQAIALIRFDDWTRPHARFAMCVDASTTATGRTADLVSHDRFRVRAAYDETFGAGTWIAVWIESPKLDPRCLEALRAMNERRSRAAEERSTGLVTSLIGLLIPAAEARPTTTH